MRSFRSRRRRIAALALLPAAALTAMTLLAIGAAGSAAGDEARKARIDTSERRVAFGDSLRLRGAFPGVAHAPVEIRHRGTGERRWRLAERTRTGAGGRWTAKVRPRSSGHWRAELAGPAPAQPEPEPGVLTAPAEASADRTSGNARVVVRSRTEASIPGRHTRVGRTVRVRGRVAPGGRSRRVVVRIGGERLGTRTKRNGRFAVSWRPRSTGTYRVTVSARGNRVAAGSRARPGRVTAYRPAAASWYGPGFYGNRTACGQTLTTSTLGVAHKTMPCGTKLRLRYGGRTVAVRVIDRGPYVGGREFDLTAATRQRLGFPSTGTVLSSR